MKPKVSNLPIVTDLPRIHHRRRGTALLVAISLAGLAMDQPAAAAERLETAVLAGGCFWGVEGVFEHVKGVRDVVSGFAGGTRTNLTRSSNQGLEPAEVVRISFDPAQISYGQLLEIFATVAHDPTQVNRQGPDVGPRYRSAIFPQNAQQRQAAERFLAQLRASGRYKRPIATRIESGRFVMAEPYHQNYMRKNPSSRYVIVNDVPKLAELRRAHPQLWRE